MNPLNPSESEICVLSTSYWLNQRFEDWPWWGSCHVASTSLRVKLAKIKSQTLGSEVLTLNKGETKWHLVTPTLGTSLCSCMDGFESFALWRYNGCISYFLTASIVNCHDSVFLTFPFLSFPLVTLAEYPGIYPLSFFFLCLRFPTEDTGSWSRTGCSLVSTNLTHSSCACDHEGLFALLGQEKVMFKCSKTYIHYSLSRDLHLLTSRHSQSN